MAAEPTIRITQVADYVFTVDFSAALPALRTDEAPPATNRSSS